MPQMSGKEHPIRQTHLVAMALIAAAASLAMVWVYNSLDDSPRLWFLGHLLYAWVPLVLLLALGAGMIRLPPRQWSRQWFARQSPMLLVVLLVTAACALWVPAEMRVQWDETNLLSTSSSMQDVRAAFVATQAAPHQGSVQAFEYMVDKRPPLFPFLVSLLHDLTGFRIQNAFACNLIVLFGLLAMVGIAVRERFDKATGSAAILLMSSVPLLVACTRSAGFELLSAALLTACVAAALDFTRHPSTPRLLWLMGAGLVFSFTRYESATVFLALLSYTLWLTKGQWAWPNVIACLTLFAALLTPIVLQYLHATQRDFYSESDPGALVSVSHAVEHLPGLLGELFDPSLAAAFPGILTWLSAIATLILLIQRRVTTTHVVIVLPVLCTTAISLLWFYGDATEPSAQRLYLPIVLLAALGGLLWRQVAQSPAITWSVLALATLLFGWHLHELREGRAFGRLKAASVADAVDSILAKLQPHQDDSLIISTVAQYLVMQGYGAISANGFERHRDRLEQLRRSGDIRDVFFLYTPVHNSQAKRFGSTLEMMQRTSAQLHCSEDGNMPIKVFRLTGDWPL